MKVADYQETRFHNDCYQHCYENSLKTNQNGNTRQSRLNRRLLHGKPKCLRGGQQTGGAFKRSGRTQSGIDEEPEIRDAQPTIEK